MEIIEKKDSFLSSALMFSCIFAYCIFGKEVELMLINYSLLNLQDKFYLHVFVGIFSFVIGSIFFKISIEKKDLRYKNGFCFIFYKNKFCFISNLIYSVLVGVGIGAIIYSTLLL